MCLLNFQDDKARCWGRNYFNEATPPTSTFKAVATGAVFSCGIKVVDSTIQCWGYNGANETMPPAGQYLEITAGSRHACAISDATTRDAVCWGLNEDNRLAAPTGVKFRASLDGTSGHIAAGAAHTCGIKDVDGTVVCWGFYSDAPPGNPAFKKLSAGFAHTCGIKDDNTVLCWPAGIPDGRSTVPSDLGTVKQIATLGSHTCAITSAEKLRCWGSDVHGESSGFVSTDTFSYVSTGWYYTCALKGDGIVGCFGENSHGRATPPAGYAICGSADTVI